MPAIPKLRFADRQFQGPCFHLTSVDWARNRLPGYHGHDYPEIFWINRGKCQHRINGQLQALSMGDLVLMRIEDCHELRPHDRAGFGFSNLSISPDIYRGVMARFDETLPAIYSQTALPGRIRLTSRQLESIQRDARLLAGQPHQAFYLERFLLNLWSRCLPQEPLGEGKGDLPDWLLEACVRVQEPEVFCEGVPAFVRLCGRSHEHVARECRHLLGKTPTAIVNEARLARAANDLRTTSRSVTEIALDCGFEDPGTFFRLFKKQYGSTPRIYRCGF